jgi:hypothetical protein
MSLTKRYVRDGKNRIIGSIRILRSCVRLHTVFRVAPSWADSGQV